MNRPAVLIVGAGATGLPVGYHLALAGADITYLVRKGRAASVRTPQHLYCYDDNTLKTFGTFDVVDDVTVLTRRRYEFVLITLDGHASRSAEGTAMLRGLGELVRSCDASVIMCGFGIGLREHHFLNLGIPEDRLSHGFLGMLSHQAAADLPVHAPADPELISQAGICYRHPRNGIGFRVDTGNPVAAKRFADLYNRSGVSRCARMSRAMDDIFSVVGFPVFAACELAGWASFSVVAGNSELWSLACRAQREILTLPRHGWRGRLMATVMGPRATRMLHERSERDNLPLDYQAFNRFHHGGKVRRQDLESMRHCLEEGRRQGLSMTALGALLERLEVHNVQQPS